MTSNAQHRPLQTDPDALPALGGSYESALAIGLAELGLEPSAALRSALEAHARLLAAWNVAVNLTAIAEPAEVARLHVCDSLSALVPLRSLAVESPSLLDLGSGSGYPGLPLGLALPASRVALVESVAKKARFLEAAAAAATARLREAREPFPEVEVHAERAEDLAHDPEHRGAWHIVTARAVGSLAEVAELALPLLRYGGWLVTWKREAEAGALRPELVAAGPIVQAAGGGRMRVLTVPAAVLDDHRLVLVRKERPTPARFPRPPAVRRAPARRSESSPKG